MVLLPNRFLLGLVVALGIGVVTRVIAHIDPKQSSDRALTETRPRSCSPSSTASARWLTCHDQDLVLSDQRQPNSWVVHLPHQTPRLYLTAGLRELLTLEELGAVLGHELTHIINRDALVMSVVGLPGSIMRGARGGGVDGMLVLAMGLLSQLVP